MFACGSGEDQWKVSPRVCSHPCCKMAFSAPKSVFSTLGMSERLMETWGMQNPSLLSLCHLSPPRGHRGPALRVLPSPPRPARAVSRFHVDIQLRAGDLYLIWVKKTHLKDLGEDKLSFPLCIKREVVEIQMNFVPGLDVGLWGPSIWHCTSSEWFPKVFLELTLT